MSSINSFEDLKMKGPVVFAICDVPLQEPFPLSPAETTDQEGVLKAGISGLPKGEGKKKQKGDSGLSSEFK